MAYTGLNLNDNQRTAVNCSNNRSLVSCPGSGKTRTIIAKILHSIDDVRDTPRKVGCITYTNTAVYEIENRLLRYGTHEDSLYYDISTIHSFCLNRIIYPYYSFCDELKSGFEIISPDSKWFQNTSAELAKNYGLKTYIIDQFSGIQRGSNGKLSYPDSIPSGAADDFIKLARANNYLIFGEIIYFAFKIILNHEFIGRAIGNYYAWLLIDEFQDTTLSQVDLLKNIHSYGKTKFFLVGDPNQSIYGFAGARPDLFLDTAMHIGAKTDITLNGNYRCSAKIVNFAEKLLPTKPKMYSVSEDKNYQDSPIIINADSTLNCVLNYFLPKIYQLNIPIGECAILAPWWLPLYHLGKELRNNNIPVIGPGARPYKSKLEFAKFAENICAYILEKDPAHIIILKRVFNYMLLSLNENQYPNIFNYNGTKILIRILKVCDKDRNKNNNAIDWLNIVGNDICSILLTEDLIDQNSKIKLLESIDQMIVGIHKNVPDPNNLKIDSLGLFANPKKCLHLMTLHGAKGREFEAVALIDLHDGRLPHFSSDESGVDEAKRVLYVGITRPRKVLMLFTDNSDYRNKPSRFLRNFN